MTKRSNNLESLGKQLWSDSGLRQALAEGVVAVLDWPLDRLADRADELLTTKEKSRAERFRFERDKIASAMARAGLRAVLAGWLGAEAARVEFTHGPHGKPRLAGDREEPALRFNLSHSGGLALLALTLGQEVGVDVQRIPTDRPPPMSVASTCFVGKELIALDQTPEQDIPEVFYRLWTQKEAVIKLTGEGLAADLQGFETSADPGNAGWVALPTDNALGIGRCWIEPVSIRPGYQATVATTERPPRVIRRQLAVGG